MHCAHEAAKYFFLTSRYRRWSPPRKATLNKWHNGKCDENLLQSFSEPKHRHYQISGSNAELVPYHHFPCLFGWLQYLMNPYRGRTVLVHMSRYLTGPFLRAPTGRVRSRDTSCKIPQLPCSWKKRKGGQESDFEFRHSCFFLFFFGGVGGLVTVERPWAQL